MHDVGSGEMFHSMDIGQEVHVDKGLLTCVMCASNLLHTDITLLEVHHLSIQLWFLIAVTVLEEKCREVEKDDR